MSESINSIKAQLWQKMSAKEYRDNFVAAHLSTGIAAQIQALREAQGWTQKQLGEKVGMTQARISLMESPGYDSYTFSTLKRLAAVFDIAIIARFAAFSELAAWASDLSPRKLAVASFSNDTIAAAAMTVEKPLQEPAAANAGTGATQAPVAHLATFGGAPSQSASSLILDQGANNLLPSFGHMAQRQSHQMGLHA